MTDTVTKPTALPLRNDTILGVCEAIGEDFGFNPLWLRLAFIAPLFWQPAMTVAAYVALGLVVAASRYFFPRTSTVAITAPRVSAQEAYEAEPLPIAA